MSLTVRQKQFLKGLAHTRKPVVLLGNAGLTPPVLAEIEQALERHELLKIRLPAVEREARSTLVREICQKTGADSVQEIGRVSVLYRCATKPRLELPVR